jgi:hypothetical protein
MNDLDFCNHKLLFCCSKTLCFWKEGLLPMSYSFPTPKNDEFYMSIPEFVLSDKGGIGFLRNFNTNSRYKFPERGYDLYNFFDPMI